MNKSISFFAALLLCVSNIGLYQQESAEVELDRDAAIKAFTQLTANAKSGLKANDAMATAKSGGKFGILAPVDVPYSGGNSYLGGCSNAVRVWFELPASYQMLMLGVATRLPVAFQMDANYRPEHMSIVVTQPSFCNCRCPSVCIGTKSLKKLRKNLRTSPFC